MRIIGKIMTKEFFVTFVRHGETTLNAQKRLQGHTNSPLSEKGINQAKLLGQYLQEEKFTSAYASDLIRASNTAKFIIGESKHPLEIQLDKRLRERCYGSAEGLSVQDFYDNAVRSGIKVSEYTPEGGETVEEIEKRSIGFFNDLCDLVDADGNEGGNILVVTHGGWLISLFRCLVNSPETDFILENFDESKAFRTVHQNTGNSKMKIESRTKPNGERVLKLLSFNNTLHINNKII